MQKIKYLIFIFICFVILFFFCSPLSLPDNSQFKETLSSKTDADFVIVFNPGGWGDTPMEESYDLLPIVKNIEKTLNEKGYKSVIIPYQRTREGFLAKFMGSKEFFNYFRKQSDEAAENIEVFLENNPGKKVLMVGLSAGAIFVDETMKKTANLQKSVFAIEIGTPFWQNKLDSQNILSLDNKNGDSLTKGEVRVLLSTLFKGPAKWLKAKFSGAELSFSLAFDFPSHKYFWDSPEVSQKIVIFFSDNFLANNF
jgi:hypothetical protein